MNLRQLLLPMIM